jgi:GNAT superfamily N-acetyltransferase
MNSIPVSIYICTGVLFMKTLTKIAVKKFSTYLKRDKYKHVLHELKLEYCTDDQDLVFIHINVIRIKKPEQQKGYGTEVMYDILKFADSYNVRLELYVSNAFGSSMERLYRFYGNLGFIWITGDKDGKMIRQALNSNKISN